MEDDGDTLKSFHLSAKVDGSSSLVSENTWPARALVVGGLRWHVSNCCHYTEEIFVENFQKKSAIATGLHPRLVGISNSWLITSKSPKKNQKELCDFI
eukprot:474428-Amorphochlora_amoeboformis.AAC.1